MGEGLARGSSPRVVLRNYTNRRNTTKFRKSGQNLIHSFSTAMWRLYPCRLQGVGKPTGGCEGPLPRRDGPGSSHDGGKRQLATNGPIFPTVAPCRLKGVSGHRTLWVSRAQMRWGARSESGLAAQGARE
jgi:hypothetical protein